MEERSWIVYFSKTNNSRQTQQGNFPKTTLVIALWKSVYEVIRFAIFN